MSLMNFVPQLNTEFCDACGSECPLNTLQVYRFEYVCPTCFREHEAASHSAAVVEFRGNSLDWFRRNTCDECHLSTAGELTEQRGLRYCRPCDTELTAQAREAEYERMRGALS